MSRLTRLLTLALVGLAALSSCREATLGSRAVLAVLPTGTNPFWQQMAAGIRAEAAADSTIRLDLKVGEADTDARNQIAILETQLQSAEPAVLIVGPASSTAIIPVIARYNTKQIPVIVVDSKLDSTELARNNAHMDVFIGSRNQQGGELAAKRLMEALASGRHRILLLGGSPEHQTALDRAAGFRTMAPKDWDLREVTANWSRAEANRATRAALTAGPLDGVFAANDEMALGAVDALRSVQTSQAAWPVIIGFDATPDAIRAIQEGQMCATIAQDPQGTGRMAIMAARQFLTGQRPGPQQFIDVRLASDSLAACVKPQGPSGDGDHL